jgi:NAD(P)-dependent dehydrogenase (short-subunit alcohol dehydrogenase family)
MAVNARAPLLMAQAAIAWLKQSRGCVVGIGSINAYTGESRQLAYAMSKAAHMTMSRNLANTFAPDGVRFNHFNVGWVLTDNEYALKQREGLPDNWPKQVAGTSNAPASRMTEPRDIAEHAAFWLSDASRPISGSVIDLEQFPIHGRIPLKEGDN